MKTNQFFVKLNEVSLRVNLLHRALEALGYPVDGKEVNSHKAGSDTLKKVHAFLTKMNINSDENILQSEETYDAIFSKLREKKLSEGNNSFVVKGSVYTISGHKLKRQKLIALGVDIHGAGRYRDISSMNEILKKGGFEYLGESSSDALKGQYEIRFYSWQYAKEDRKKADVIVFAIEGDKITGRSRIANSEEYSDKGEIRDLNVIVVKEEDKSEYELLMNKLTSFLNQNKLKLIDLSKSADQIKYAAGELNEKPAKIQIAVDAESVRESIVNKKSPKNESEKLSHELLYAIGRQQIQLDLTAMYLMKDSEIRKAIDLSLKSNIIGTVSKKEISRFLELLHNSSASYILEYKGKDKSDSLDTVLSNSLRTREQRSAFVNAARSFQGQDYSKFWNDYLRKVKEFKENPQLIKSLLLTNQLAAMSGRHNSLMKELQANRKIKSLTQLIEYDREEWRKILKKTGVPDFIEGDTEEEKISIYADYLQSALNAAFPTQRILSMLKGNKIHVQDKAISKDIISFLAKNKDFDIASSRIENFDKAIKKASSSKNSENVKNQLKRMQRIFQVSPTPEVMSSLMTTKLDSAYSIVSIPKKSFVSKYRKLLGGDVTADSVYQRALFVNARASMQTMKNNELKGVYGSLVQQNYKDTSKKALKDNVASYSNLFGSPDIYECEHSKSVYSASAYFVDLLRFLSKCGTSGSDEESDPNAERSPLDILLQKRPDLQYLKLTSENSETLIPYIDLVNEVMEFYTIKSFLNKEAAYDTGDATAEELRATPKHFKADAYKILNKSVYPFSLPYNQPLDVIRTFCEQFNIELSQLMKDVQTDFSDRANTAIRAENLKLSEEEYIAVTGEDFNGSQDTKPLHEYFGYEIDSYLEKMAGINESDGIHEFLRRSGISYVELNDLLKTEFINPGRSALDFINRIFAGSILSPQEIYDKMKKISNNSITTISDSDLLATELDKYGIELNEFIGWTKKHFNELKNTITLYQPSSKCDLNTTSLHTIGSIYSNAKSSGITESSWIRIHRFIRLWRKLGWTIHEVDLMLTAVKHVKMSNRIKKLSCAVELNKKLKLQINELSILWGNIETTGINSLYRRLFLKGRVALKDSVFKEDAFGRFLEKENNTIEKHKSAILSAFRITENELDLILSSVPEIEHSGSQKEYSLSVSNLSILYRYVILSRAMKLRVSELINIIKLFDKKNLFETPYNTEDFSKLVSSIKNAGVNAETLQYILDEKCREESSLRLNSDRVSQILRTIQESFVLIENEYIGATANTVTGETQEQPDYKLIADTKKKNVIVQQIASLLELSEKSSVILFETELDSILGIISENILSKDFPSENTMIEFKKKITPYHCAAKFISGFKLNEKELEYISKNKEDFESINFSEINTKQWESVLNYVDLRNSFSQDQSTFIDLFKKSHENYELITDDLHNQLCLIAKLDSRSFGKFDQPSEYRDIGKLLKLTKTIKIAGKLGLTIGSLLKFGEIKTDFNALSKTANKLKDALKTRYEENEWLKLSGQLNDTIRENQKQALISHLLTKKQLIEISVKDADSLFEYFLIDVQMGACMDTSRIVQATAAVQMFVNRCLLNLESKIVSGKEKGVSSDAIDSERWEWMKNYRLWEANRKTFLYPENWLEPEWRDDRSCFFKELESELIQNDITDRSVETAFRSYLTKLNTVANLDICGMYQENDGDAMLHIFGRTHNMPYQFFYRTYNKYQRWSAWDRVQVDIRIAEQGNEGGVHLIPIVWKNRLFLFWPEFTEIQQEAEVVSNSTANDLAIKNTSELKSKKALQINLGWSEYIDKKWSAKELSKEYLEITDAEIKDLTFKSSISPTTNGLRIRMYNKQNRPLSAFYLSDIHSKIGISKFQKVTKDSIKEAVNKGVFNVFETKDNDSAKTILNLEDAFKSINLTQMDTNSLTIGLYDYANLKSSAYQSFYMKHKRLGPLSLNKKTFLKKSGEHMLLYSSDIIDFEKSFMNPCFFYDGLRTYFIRPVNVPLRDYLINPDSYKPLLTEFPDDYSEFSGLEALKNKSENSKVIKTEKLKNLSSTDKNGLKDFVLVNGPFQSVQTKALSCLNGISSLKLLPVRGMEFNTFYHPFSGQFMTELNLNGIKGLMDQDTMITDDGGSTFIDNYEPNTELVPKPHDFKDRTYYKESVCFDRFGAYNIYNWELFFHVPMYLATRLNKNGKYKEAMKWFHFIFDPTEDEQTSNKKNKTSRFWKVAPFKKIESETVDEILEKVSSGNDLEEDAISEWIDNPFKPHIIASNRPLAYMKNIVIKYVENLVAWGDSLFRAFTRESVNEALQLYVIANHILGPRPQLVPKRGETSAETYFSLKNKLDDFSNAIVDLENSFPNSSAILKSKSSSSPSLLGIGNAFYFCIPENEKLLEYWDTVSDRLFKIRHCMDIDGIERELALFSPPIDPALLIDAMAQGLSFAEILDDINTPQSIYRFSYLIQRANEFCSDVKTLGNALLSALEKKDSEEFVRLRTSHESAMLQLMTKIKEKQVLDARVSKEGILKARETAKYRFLHYLSLLGNDGLTVPSIPEVSSEINSDSQLPADTRIQEILADIDDSLVDINERGLKLISKEKEDIDLSNEAKNFIIGSGVNEVIAGVMSLIPEFEASTEPLGIGVALGSGGKMIAGMFSAMAKAAQVEGSTNSMSAAEAQKLAGYIRREQDWTLQANMAAKEIIQLDKQITSADIKIQIAKKDLENHKKQIENSNQVEMSLKEKFTNQEMYQWLKEQLFSVYKQSYDMAFDLAKKAEYCFKNETGIEYTENTSVVQYGYWDNMKQGLCAGEKLQLSLRQMEKSYLEENKRELELTKNISIALLNPLALQELRTTGWCSLTIPEEFYDLDYPGHYFRRIKSVSLSLPCIAGPYTTVSCTLRLLKNTMRINASLDPEYQHKNKDGVWTDDIRFRESNIPVKSIATSTGQRDSGMFELSFRDERYLPFEGAGAISEWRIELTKDEDLRQFDYSTISDVILHISYTAREGVDETKVTEHLKDYLSRSIDSEGAPLKCMFSLKHDFPNEWHSFENKDHSDSEKEITILLCKEHFPYITRNSSIEIGDIEGYEITSSGSSAKIKAKNLSLEEDNNIFSPITIKLEKGENKLEDIFLYLRYSLKFS